jgi:DNA (cytosine-5)-methyltransferase 1
MAAMAILLDLYCGAGGAARGYADAGFQVVGVDLHPQPHYPFEFYQEDAIEFLTRYGRDFDLIHASPPCQAYTCLRQLVEARFGKKDYPDLIDATRQALRRVGRPYVIENVPGAPLIDPVLLCGTMFRLRVYRHRLFETSFPILVPPHPPHRGRTCAHRGISSFARGATHISVAGHNFRLADAREAMGISWMSSSEIAQAIPPTYTAFIGEWYLSLYHRR